LDTYNFLVSVLSKLAAGAEVVAEDSTTISPTYLPDMVHATLDLLIDGESGIWHLTNRETLSPHELAARLGKIAGIARLRIAGCSSKTHIAALDSERGWPMPSLDNALNRFLCDCKLDWRMAADCAVRA
jgi:dTDP-4-dehydrorhamnose reductase